jgi:hypothetical protein
VRCLLCLPGETAPERLPSAFLAECLLSEHDPDYAQARRQHAAAVNRGARLPLHARRTLMYAYDNKTVRASLPRDPLDAHYHVKWTPGEEQAFLRSPGSAWLVIALCVSLCMRVCVWTIGGAEEYSRKHWADCSVCGPYGMCDLTDPGLAMHCRVCVVASACSAWSRGRVLCSGLCVVYRGAGVRVA